MCFKACHVSLFHAHIISSYMKISRNSNTKRFERSEKKASQIFSWINLRQNFETFCRGKFEIMNNLFDGSVHMLRKEYKEHELYLSWNFSDDSSFLIIKASSLRRITTCQRSHSSFHAEVFKFTSPVSTKRA